MPRCVAELRPRSVAGAGGLASFRVPAAGQNVPRPDGAWENEEMGACHCCSVRGLDADQRRKGVESLQFRGVKRCRRALMTADSWGAMIGVELEDRPRNRAWQTTGRVRHAR